MRTNLHSLLIGVVSLAAIHPVLAQPALGIIPTNNQVILFWPSNAVSSSYVMQSSTNLASTNWVFATDPVPSTYGTNIALAVTNAETTRFFRLFSPPATTADGMVVIPAGWFTIGDTLDGESDAISTNVYVSAFYMDTNLVNYGEYQLFFAYATNHGFGYDFPSAGAGKTTNCPVTNVGWYDCVKSCNARSEQAGLTPVYYTDAGLTQVYTNGDVSPYVNWTANGYRLPTEAEWEKAARGGLSGLRFPLGNTISESQANYNANTATNYDLGPNGYNTIGKIGGSPYTSPVGSFPPNDYGLYDMAGNVWEWCWDWYAAPPYPTGSAYLGGNDPKGAAIGSYRIFRGGDWFNNAYFERCALRNGNTPNSGGVNLGFRCVRGL